MFVFVHNLVTWLLLLVVYTSSEIHADTNFFRGQNATELRASPFTISTNALLELADKVIAKFPARSFLQCNTYCLPNTDCAGVMYDAQQNCHLLKTTASVIDHADANGTVRVLLLEKEGSAGVLCGSEGAAVQNAPQFDCLYWYEQGYTQDGIYCINPDGSGTFEAFCDMTQDGGGWTVFQRRIDASVDFYRGWADYVAGFGDLDGNLWLGLDHIHALTSAGYNTELHVYMDTFEDESAMAHYGTFAVGDAVSEYPLTVDGYSGTAGNSMSNQNTKKFTTIDNDNDESSQNCAVNFKGAWWHKACTFSNLNALYLAGAHTQSNQGVTWYAFKGNSYSMKTAIMKLRRLP